MTAGVVALHVAKATRLPMRAVDAVEAEAGRGLVGDRYHGTRHRHPPGRRRPRRRGRAGTVFRVLESGTIEVGDRV